MLDSKYFEEMPKFTDFHYWFVYNADGTFSIYDVAVVEGEPVLITKAGYDHVDTIYLSEEFLTQNGTSIAEDIYADWKKFIDGRPEAAIGELEWISEPRSDMETIQNSYEQLLLGCLLIRTADGFRHNPDDYINKAMRSIEWLRTTDFFTCPASTQYHDSVPGGLVNHTLNVVYRMVDLMKTDSFKDVDPAGAILTALVHDWCKIGLYDPYMKNVKKEQTGQWDKVPAYKYRTDRAITLGHGTSSMYLAMRFFNLNLQEAEAIRWHMGRWNVVDSEINELQQANRSNPLAHLLQFADQLAIVNY